MSWKKLQPNEHGDWLSQRNDVFGTFIPIEPEKKYDVNTQTYFNANSLGLCTNRDAWCYNSSKKNIKNNLSFSIDFYNQQMDAFEKMRKQNQKLKFDDFITYDSTKLNWTDTVKRDAEKGIKYKFENDSLTKGLYRPYFKQCVYFSNNLNHRVYQLPKLFPKPDLYNKVICTTGIGASKDCPESSQ